MRLQELIPGLEIYSVPSGTKVFDWTVPDEWNITDAYIMDADGNKVVNFANNNLHVVGYSEPIDEILDRWELETFIHSLPAQPDAIPYITSYYRRRWGFCMTHNQRLALKDGLYRAVINSFLAPGHLDYADLLIPGESDQEVLLSTYICHPSLANDNLSGVVVTAALARWLQSLPRRRFSYRIVFIPETIGAIAYLAKHLDHMKEKTIAGYVVTCVGAGKRFNIISSRQGNTISDKFAALATYSTPYPVIKPHLYTERGSDERQYCWPGVDLPIASITLDKYGEYPQYHTSLDNLEFISQERLEASLELYKTCLQLIDFNRNFKCTTICEPFLTKHGVYPQTSPSSVPDELNVLAYCDGTNDVYDLMLKSGLRGEDTILTLNKLLEKGLIE
jgi:aminopeptidase-like protein